jgi:hypothetical protein
MEIGDQLYLYRQQARHHTSDVVSPILADIALTMCVGFYVLWRNGSKKPDHTARQSRNQKAGKYILAGITPADNVHDVIKVNPDDDSVDLLAEEINY